MAACLLDQVFKGQKYNYVSREREKEAKLKKNILVRLVRHFAYNISRKIWHQCDFVCYEANNSVVHISLDPSYTLPIGKC